jgi:hypothetical protein
VLAIAQRLPQSSNLKPQTAFFHNDVRPDPSQEISFAHDLVGAGYQSNQNVEGSRADFHRGAFFREDSLACDQAERTKRDDVSGLRRRACHGVFLRSPLAGLHPRSRIGLAPYTESELTPFASEAIEILVAGLPCRAEVPEQIAATGRALRIATAHNC